MSVDTQDMLAKLSDKNWVETFKKTTRLDFRIALVRNYNVQNQEEEAVMQWLINHLDPPRPSVTQTDIVRAEMAQEESNGYKDHPEHNVETPEGEEYWQNRLDKAQEEDARRSEETLIKSYEEIKKRLPDINFPDIQRKHGPIEKPDTPKLTVNMKTGKIRETQDEVEVKQEKKEEKPAMPKPQEESKKLKDLPGFGEGTVAKFKEAGIMDTDKLFELTYDQAKKIAGTHLVLRAIQDKFKS
jgi:predicted flap endonuclease-1-like 5' DNA nuclease